MTVTDLIAFLDESKKPVRDRATGRVTAGGEFYVVAAAVVFHGELDLVRAELAAIEAQLGFTLHYQEMSKQRKTEAIKAIELINAWDGYLFETARPLPARHYSEHHIRAKILAQAFVHLGSDEGLSQVVLETRAHSAKGFDQLDKKDNQVLQKLLSRKEVPEDMRIRHEGKNEAVLKIADMLAGARSDSLCGANDEVYPLIGHRIRSIKTAFNAL